MKEKVFNVWVRAQIAKQTGKDKLASLKNSVISEERGGPSDLIIPLVILIILIALAVVFRTQLSDFVNNLFKTAKTDLDNAVTASS